MPDWKSSGVTQVNLSPKRSGRKRTVHLAPREVAATAGPVFFLRTLCRAADTGEVKNKVKMRVEKITIIFSFTVN